MKKRSVTIRGHRTSYSLEEAFAIELRKIAEKSSLPLAELVTQIDSQRSPGTNLSSALRLHVLNHLKQRLGEMER